jgi:uncharacterized protein (DUF4415 family)
MNSKRLAGIDDVLSHLISTPTEGSSKHSTSTSGEGESAPSKPGNRKQKDARTEKTSKKTHEIDNSQHIQNARLGRPPAAKSTPQAPKEKLTVRIPRDLAAEYRDWSWEGRCSLSSLVERAMLEYHKRSSR